MPGPSRVFLTSPHRSATPPTPPTPSAHPRPTALARAACAHAFSRGAGAAGCGEGAGLAGRTLGLRETLGRGEGLHGQRGSVGFASPADGTGGVPIERTCGGSCERPKPLIFQFGVDAVGVFFFNFLLAIASSLDGVSTRIHPPHPPTHLLSTPVERTEERFPIIVKPGESGGSDGVKLCATPVEAEQHFQLLMTRGVGVGTWEEGRRMYRGCSEYFLGGRWKRWVGN